MFEKSAGIALALNPFIGSEKAAEVAKEALKRGFLCGRWPSRKVSSGVQGKGKGKGK